MSIGGILSYTVGKKQEFIDEFRKMRFDGRISKFISYSYDLLNNEIQIHLDEGRFIRPLITVDKNTSAVTDQDERDIIMGKYKSY